MGTSKSAITSGNVHSWLAATGFLFPSNEAELCRLEKLLAEVVIPEAELLDPDVILGRKQRAILVRVKELGRPSQVSMVARNGKGVVPQHILDKMMKNQNKSKNDADGHSEEKAD